MTENGKPKSRRGGRRDGAGRPRKLREPTVLDEDTIGLLIADVAPDQIETSAQRYARSAVLALVKKMLRGGHESARVTAANQILDRGYGKPGVDIGGDAAQGSLYLSVPTLRGFEITSSEVRTEARKYANLAVLVLARIAEFGRSESACVSAATSLLNRGLGMVGTAKMPDEFKDVRLGKKEAAAIAAEAAATGKYATPSAPGAKTNKRDDEQ